MKFYRNPLHFYRNWEKHGLKNAININKLTNRRKNEVLKLSINLGGEKIEILLRNNSTDYTIFKQIFGSKDYNFDFPFEPEIIIDAGAYAGFSSVFFALKYPDSRVFAIEPDNENYSFLIKNTFKLPNITPINSALWSEDTMISLIKTDNYYKDSIRVNEEFTNSDHKVNAITINALINKYSLKKIDVLKVDIEGAEYQVFSHNFEWIDIVRVIIIELHDYIKEGSSAAFFKLISDHGFSIVLRGENLVCFRSYSDYMKTLKKW